MGSITEIIVWATANLPQFIAAVNAVVLALITLFLLIPGEQPEKALRAVADVLAKFSLK